MEEKPDNNSPKQPIDDVKPPVPEATSTGAEFSDDLGPQPFPPKDSQQSGQKSAQQDSTQQQPKEVADHPVEPPPAQNTAPTESQTATTDRPTPAPEGPPANQQTEGEKTKQSTAKTSEKPKDHGVHRSAPKTPNVGLAVLVGLIGLSLCGLVIWVYFATN